MTNAKQKIKSCFNKAAKTYDNNCYLQDTTGKHLVSYLLQHQSAIHSLLDIGCGTGKLTSQLANRIQCEKFIAMDISDKFLEIAKPRFASQSIIGLNADFDDLPIQNNSMDIVFSNMALHWSLNLQQTLKEIFRIIRPGGLLFFTMPIKNTFHQLINCQKQITENFHNEFMTELSLVQSTEDSGFQVLNSHQKNYTLYFPSLFHLLKSIKQVGATYLKTSKSLIKSRLILKKIEDYYLLNFGNEDKQLPLTYDIIFVVAKKSL